MVFKNLVVHPQVVMKGHYAGCAAAKQGKFVAFKHAWWDKAWPTYTQTHQITDETINAVATAAGLDMDQFKKDEDSSECKQQIQSDAQELQKWHVNATPNFFINGRYFVWNGDPAAFKTAIDERLKDVEKSGASCDAFYAEEVMKKGEQKYRKKGDPKPGA